MKNIGVWFFGSVFILAGILHFASPDVFIRLIPPGWPARAVLNALAGIAEILSGIGFLVPRTRRAAGYVLCLMLLVFWVLHGIHLVYPPNPEWPYYGYVIRFCLQPVLIFLVWKLKDHKQVV